MKSLKIMTVLCAAVISVSAMSIAAGAVNTETNYLRGDANGDGMVTVSDVTAIQRHLVDMQQISGADLKAADVDGNELDISDATKIQRYLAEFTDPYQINEWVTTEPETQPATYYIKPGDNELPFIPN